VNFAAFSEEDALRREKELAAKAAHHFRVVLAALRDLDSTAVIFYDHATIMRQTVEIERFTGGSNDSSRY
jgi:hypothetical protein